MRHIGFIMDGNRRYARKLSTLISLGHARGGDTLEAVIELCARDPDVEYASFWVLSRENIVERSQDEVSAIYDLFRQRIPKLIENFRDNNIELHIVGDLWILPHDIRELLLSAIDMTHIDVSGTPSLRVILAIAYSGQDEIVRAVRRFVTEGGDISTVDTEKFLDYLDTGAYPPPDIIVRTGGNIRHSGYFLYQSDYSEYYFTDRLWPEFDAGEYEKVKKYFASIQRNFGK